MDNLEIIRTLHHIWSSGDTELVPEVYSPDFVGYWPPSALIPERRGHEGVLLGVRALRSAFPDWKEDVVELFGKDDKVMSRTVASGTHLDHFGDLKPTGNFVKIYEASTFRISEGKVIEHRCLFDELARLTCLDVDRTYLQRMLKR